MKILTIILVTFLFLSCNQNQKKEENTIIKIGSGTITTIADGFDVQRVNLWNSISSGRKVSAYMTNGEEVIILKDEDPYFLVESANGDGRKGYCMKDFVILKK